MPDAHLGLHGTRARGDHVPAACCVSSHLRHVRIPKYAYTPRMHIICPALRVWLLCHTGMLHTTSNDSGVRHIYDHVMHGRGLRFPAAARGGRPLSAVPASCVAQRLQPFLGHPLRARACALARPRVAQSVVLRTTLHHAVATTTTTTHTTAAHATAAAAGVAATRTGAAAARLSSAAQGA